MERSKQEQIIHETFFELLIKMLRHGMSSICLSSIAFFIHFRISSTNDGGARAEGEWRATTKVLIGTFQSLSDLLEMFFPLVSSCSFASATTTTAMGKTSFHEAP